MWVWTRDEKGEERGDEGWCVPAGCAMEGMSELPPSLLPPSLLPLCRFTCHLHGVVTVRVCDLDGGCTPCTPCTPCDLHTSDAHAHSFSPPPRCPTLSVQAQQCSCDAVWLLLHPLVLLVAASSHSTSSSSSLFNFSIAALPAVLGVCVEREKRMRVSHSHTTGLLPTTPGWWLLVCAGG